MQKLSEHSKTLILGGAALFLGVIFPILFYEKGIGLNFALFVLAVVSSGLFLSGIFSRRMKRGEYVLIVLALFFSSMVFVRSSDLLTFFNVVGSFLLLFVAISTYTGTPVASYLFGDYLKAFFTPFRFVGPFFETFPEILSLSKLGGVHSKRKEIIRGSLMAIVAVIVFSGLFASADALFERILSRIFIFEFDQELLNRFFLGTVVTAFFIGAFGFMFRKLHASPATLSLPISRNLGALETMILLGAINILFLVFILLQLTYLFGGASHLLADGFTYAEYARKGFFELVLVAVFSYFIISIAEKQIIKKEESHIQSFKILSTVLIVQVVFILFSAFTRLSLYEDAYGFTDTRLYSHALMIWIGVVLLLLSHHILTNGARAAFTLRAACTIVILLFTMNMLNPDVFIAKKNLERYAKTGELDASYLGSLSDDALPYTIQLLDDPKEEISKSFARALYYRDHYYCSLDDCESGGPDHSWQSVRLDRARGDELLSSRQDMLKANKDYRPTENSLAD